MKNALEVLTATRDHVAKRGATGGNPDYFADCQVCPRGLVGHFSGEKWEIGPRPGSVRAEALYCLDEAARKTFARRGTPIATYSLPGRAIELASSRGLGLTRDEQVAMYQLAIDIHVARATPGAEIKASESGEIKSRRRLRSIVRRGQHKREKVTA